MEASRGFAHGVRLRATWQIWRTILWREWQVNRSWLKSLFWVWILLFLVVPVVVDEWDILQLCVLLGLIVALRTGGSDSSEQAEEFSIALPPRRLDYFLVRGSGGLAVVLVFAVAAILLSRMALEVWGMVAELLAPGGVIFGFKASHGDPGWVASSWNLVLALLVCSFVSTFSWAATLPRRALIGAAFAGIGFPVAIGAFFMVMIGVRFDYGPTELLIALTLIVSICAVAVCLRREYGNVRHRWWVIIGLLFAVFLATSGFAVVAVLVWVGWLPLLRTSPVLPFAACMIVMAHLWGRTLARTTKEIPRWARIGLGVAAAVAIVLIVVAHQEAVRTVIPEGIARLWSARESGEELQPTWGRIHYEGPSHFFHVFGLPAVGLLLSAGALGLTCPCRWRGPAWITLSIAAIGLLMVLEHRSVLVSKEMLQRADVRAQPELLQLWKNKEQKTFFWPRNRTVRPSDP
ncbi:MAG: hypothetical protein R3F19_17365 [Verrucomicrobiales bacterium]